MHILPPQFLFRFCFPCYRVKGLPSSGDDQLVDLPAVCRLDDRIWLWTGPHFADVRVGWNESGLGLQVVVRGKERPCRGNADHPRSSDGFWIWLDMRDTRTIHRATRYCHQFYFLPTGAGPDRDQPACGQWKINRALEDAPLASADELLYVCRPQTGGYRMEIFLPAAVLYGFDPESNRRLGFFYTVRDAELGEQTLGLGPEFPFWEDPSLWSTLELVDETVG